MNKSVKIIISILAILLVFGLVFWSVRNRKQQTANNDQKVVENQNNNSASDSNQTSDEVIQEENLQIHNGECQDNSKPDSQGLVYYCVPELGIKFKVTKDTKNDEKYFIKENEEFDTLFAYFFSGSVKDFISKNSSIKRFSDESYVESVISKISGEENDKYKEIYSRPLCFDEDILARNNGYIYCKESIQASPFDSKEQYEQYEKIASDKKFGTFLKTIQFIN